MENVILVDFDVPKDWIFSKALRMATKKEWKVIQAISNRNHGNVYQKFLRYLKYFTFPFKIFLNRNKYAHVFAWQQFYGLVLAFYFRIFGVKNAPEITVMTFIYKPKKNIFGSMYANFIRYVVKSGYINKFIVFSNNEKKYYAELFDVPEEYFLVATLGLEDQYDLYSTKTEDFFVSAGRSNRDYSFLIKSWGNENQLIIICDTCNENDTEYIKIMKHCHDEQYMQELARSYAVIVPLEEENISSGQLVILQAMMLKKPVIVTKNKTVVEYIEHGKEGFIIDKNKEALERAIRQLKIPEVYEVMAECARRRFVNNFSLHAMGTQIGERI